MNENFQEKNKLGRKIGNFGCINIQVKLKLMGVGSEMLFEDLHSGLFGFCFTAYQSQWVI